MIWDHPPAHICGMVLSVGAVDPGLSLLDYTMLLASELLKNVTTILSIIGDFFRMFVFVTWRNLEGETSFCQPDRQKLH